MKKNLPIILIAGFTVIVIAGLFVLALSQNNSTSSSNGNTNGQPIAVGQTAPNFSLTNVSGGTISLASYKSKEPVFLEFFAIWCPHCQHMAPIVESLSQQYKNKIQFMSVQASPYGKNYETQGNTTPATINDLKWFQSTFNISFPILEDQQTSTATTYGIAGFPTFYIIDKTGKVTYTSSGEQPQSTLQTEIQKVI